MSHPLFQITLSVSEQVKNMFSKTIVTVGAPFTGAGISAFSLFLEKIIPALTVFSLLTGIVLGILSYRLKLKNSKKNDH